ncbi:YdaS family helix-turn-helix protein [Paraburkholderia fungorum]|uniref:transcriptional regulator n=1 Tax=Paraburkholderia fungorum TaxID=134537 RepID=UPI000D3F83F9|nr:YdaS family helix-turn-helix protein [Paraburkholderia fungorum]PRZ56140.1 DNA-binding transcriptional regulator YdaS (Cro superfamily) [Paraburkholderia fungorum]
MDTFRAFFKALTKAERETFAAAVGTSVAYLWQIAYKQRRCSESMAIEIEKASKRAVCVEDLRSDVDWAYIRASAQSIAESEPPADVVERAKASDDVQPPVGGTNKTKLARMEI